MAGEGKLEPMQGQNLQRRHIFAHTTVRVGTGDRAHPGPYVVDRVIGTADRQDDTGVTFSKSAATSSMNTVSTSAFLRQASELSFSGLIPYKLL